MNKKKRIICFKFVLLLLIVYLIVFPNCSLAATPKIVDKMTKAFEQIEKWLISLSTPSAAIAVAVGLFMKKFSFGDEERIRSAKKIIKGSLVAYAILLTLDLILAAIKSLVA